MIVNFAIIGCGYISNRHAQHIIDHPEANLVGGFDTTGQKKYDFARKYKVKAYKSLEELLGDAEVDLVVVATPNGNHAASAIAALKAGKDVLVEKPMAISSEDCREMVKTAQNLGQHLFVVKQNRFNPPVEAVKKLIDENKLGKIYSVVVNCFWNRNEAYYKKSEWKGTKALDGGTLFTQFSHFVDIMYYLFGNVAIKSGMVQNANHQGLIEFEDTGHFLLQFEKDNAQGTFNFTTACFEQNMEGSITIFAENASIKIGGKYLNTIDYQKTKDFDIRNLPKSAPANDYGYYQGSMSNHDKVLHNVIETVNGREQIMTSGEDGLKVVEIIEKMYECGNLI